MHLKSYTFIISWANTPMVRKCKVIVCWYTVTLKIINIRTRVGIPGNSAVRNMWFLFTFTSVNKAFLPRLQRACNLWPMTICRLNLQTSNRNLFSPSKITVIGECYFGIFIVKGTRNMLRWKRLDFMYKSIYVLQ